MDFLLVINLLSHLGNEAEIDSSQTKLYHSLQNCIFHYALHNKKIQEEGKQCLTAEDGCSLWKRSATGQPANDLLRLNSDPFIFPLCCIKSSDHHKCLPLLWKIHKCFATVTMCSYFWALEESNRYSFILFFKQWDLKKKKTHCLKQDHCDVTKGI